MLVVRSLMCLNIVACCASNSCACLFVTREALHDNVWTALRSQFDKRFPVISVDLAKSSVQSIVNNLAAMQQLLLQKALELNFHRGVAFPCATPVTREPTGSCLVSLWQRHRLI